MMNHVPAPTFRTLFLEWRLDPGRASRVVLLAVLSVGGVRRLARRSPPRHWPLGRTLSFLGGLVTIVVATQSGFARYDVVVFSLHTLQHILLAMVAPALLAL